MNQLKPNEIEQLIQILQSRFLKNPHRHSELIWDEIEVKLRQNSQKLISLQYMEQTGGEPDVIGFDTSTNEFIFCDCVKESPLGRRSLCYDRKALESRKSFPPISSVLDIVEEMGVELLNEEMYYKLQQLDKFDLKTSSWIQTPDEIRSLGGAIFCDRRYGKIFTYHNGADSYFASRGFRGLVRI